LNLCACKRIDEPFSLPIWSSTIHLQSSTTTTTALLSVVYIIIGAKGRQRPRASLYVQPVRFSGLLGLNVLFVGLLSEKNTVGWLLISMISSNVTYRLP
jgi:hypothetical protein